MQRCNAYPSVWAAPVVVLRFGLVRDASVALVQKGVKQIETMINLNSHLDVES